MRYVQLHDFPVRIYHNGRNCWHDGRDCMQEIASLSVNVRLERIGCYTSSMWEKRGSVIADRDFDNCYWGLSGEVGDAGL